MIYFNILLIFVLNLIAGCYLTPLINLGIEEIEEYYEEQSNINTNVIAVTNTPINTITNTNELTDEQYAEKYKDGPNTIEQGRRGFIWKPKSDNNGYPVVILPPRFTNKTPKFVLVNGEKWGRTSVGNGYREHFRQSRGNLKHLTGQVIIEVDAKDGITGNSYKWQWVVSNASIRFDSNVNPNKK